jgi:L-threonylcarbamoyladenylate synthase
MPTTKIIQFSAANVNTDGLREAVATLRSGGLVAFPTETVYGLGADAFNACAVQKVFQAKGRPSNNPLIVHVASMEIAWHFITEISEKGLSLAKHFWPGPLTLVVRRKAIVPDIVTSGLDTVAIRIPDHPVTLELLKIFEGGIVGPSANISGRPSPTTADHVFQDLQGKIDMILDSGPTTIGMESTVIDVTVDPPVILRIGGLNREDIEKEIGTIRQTNAQELLQRSPGTRHRHYAPRAHVVLIPKNNREIFEQQINKMKNNGIKVGVITYSEDLNRIDATKFHLILSSSIEQYAQNIFRAIRELDNLSVDCMIIESVEEKGLGAAIMDRLVKAAQRSKS